MLWHLRIHRNDEFDEELETAYDMMNRGMTNGAGAKQAIKDTKAGKS